MKKGMRCVLMPIPRQKLHEIVLDEEMAAREYAKFSKKFRNKSIQKMFKKMSQDEARHAKNIGRLEAKSC